MPHKYTIIVKQLVVGKYSKTLPLLQFAIQKYHIDNRSALPVITVVKLNKTCVLYGKLRSSKTEDNYRLKPSALRTLQTFSYAI